MADAKTNSTFGSSAEFLEPIQKVISHFILINIFHSFHIQKIQNRMKVKINIEKLSEVLIGTVSENFLYDSFSKLVSAVSIQKSIQTPYTKKRKSSGFPKSLKAKKPEYGLYSSFFLVHPQGFEPRTF